MRDLSDWLNRNAEGIRSQPDALVQVQQRARKVRIRRRVGTGLVATALSIGTIGLAVSAFSRDRESQPAVSPTSTPSPTASFVPLALYVENRSGVQGLADQTVTLAGGASTDPIHFSVVFSTDAPKPSADSLSEVMYS